MVDSFAGENYCVPNDSSLTFVFSHHTFARIVYVQTNRVLFDGREFHFDCLELELFSLFVLANVDNMSEASGSCGADFAQEQCLLVHNFPRTFSEADTRQLLQLFDPISVEILAPYRAVYATFSSKQHARDVLVVLHQQILDGQRLYVEYAEGNARDMTAILKRSGVVNDKRDELNCAKPSIEATVGDVLRKLYATSDNLNFNQPPPPHLRYNYPLVNRDIVDSISIALETSRKFYVQVLHLMNRMNLEPPFVSGDKKLKFEPQIELHSKPPSTRGNVSTQTEEIAWQNFIRNKRKRVASDESELDTTSSDGEETAKMTQPQRKVKADQISMLSKLKQCRMLKMQRIQMEANGEKSQTADAIPSMSSVFDSPHPVARAIKIIAPRILQPTGNNEIPIETIPIDTSERATIDESATNAILTDDQIRENRVPDDQLKTHPLFQGYEPGEVTNRLYIKNIAKEVTEDDLRAIYHRYLEQNCNGVGNVRSIDIRLMQTGRMKGQAFVTFNGPYLDCIDEIDGARKYQMIAKALSETNGLLVKSKVLVVTYGKKK